MAILVVRASTKLSFKLEGRKQTFKVCTRRMYVMCKYGLREIGHTTVQPADIVRSHTSSLQPLAFQVVAASCVKQVSSKSQNDEAYRLQSP